MQTSVARFDAEGGANRLRVSYGRLVRFDLRLVDAVGTLHLRPRLLPQSANAGDLLRRQIESLERQPRSFGRKGVTDVGLTFDAVDQGERMRVYHEVDRLWVGEHAAILPIAYARSILLRRPWIEGLWASPLSRAHLDTVVVGDSAAATPAEPAVVPVPDEA